MSCGIPGHVHDEADLDAVYRCNLCNTEFEAGVADPVDGHLPRCPQCFMSDASQIERTEWQSFVIRKSTKFR